MNVRKPRENPEKPGPKPDQLKLEGDWKDATKKALAKERPPEGWPKPEEESSDE